MSDPDHLSRALQLLASGRLDEARTYLEELLRQDPDNPDLLYNLGLCYVDLGQLDKGIELLHRCLQIVPQHSHACVALGIAYQKKCDLPRAKEYAMRAFDADPRNPVALKNLGAINGQEGDSLRALYHLRQSYEIDPKDPQTVYGLAFAYMKLGDIEQAQKHFQAVLEMEAPEDLRGLAKNGLREIAVQGLKAKGPRMDAVFYLLDAMLLFQGKSLEEIKEITFEIGMLGQHGLDINDPQETHVLRSLPGRTFSALELVCIMYAGFKRIEPGMDIGGKKDCRARDGIVDLLSQSLTAEYGRGFSRRNLFHMIRMADTFEDDKTVQTQSAQFLRERERFLLELGTDFSFIARQKRMTMERR